MRQLTNQKIATFCEELAWLIHSGISVGDGLTLLAEEETESEWQECLSRMAIQMNKGSSFSEVLKEETIFPVYVQGNISVGEKTGRLEEALKALCRYYEEKERMSQRTKSALLYPSILSVLMLIVLVVLLTQILPIFQSVFVSLGTQMDGVAGVLLSVGLWLNDGIPILCAVFGLVMVLVLLFALSISFREKVEKLWRRLAGDQGVMRKLNDAALAHAISLGLSSGLMLEETMELASEIMEDIPKAKKRCVQCKEELQNGSTLVDALKNAEILPITMCRLLSIGVQSGNGDVVMVDIAEKLSEEADIAMSKRVAKVEPTLVLTTSILIGMILLLVMLPLINIMEMIG